MKFMDDYFAYAGRLEIEPPYFIFLSFVGIKGCRFAGPRELMRPETFSMLREQFIMLPEIIVQDRESQPQEFMRPAFDMVWNAFGFARSFNFDNEGNWVE